MAGESMVWIDSTGASHDISSNSINIATTRDGRSGMAMPPVSLVDQRTPLFPGTIIRFADVMPRPVILPLIVNCGGSENTLAQTKRSMAAWFNPNAAGILQNTAPDGVVRQLTATYQDGLQGDESPQNRGPGWQKFVLTFLAADPFWYDQNSTVFTAKNNQPAMLNNNFLPLQLAGAIRDVVFTINNTGDWETFPVWEVFGPGSNLIIFNMTTNKSINMGNGAGLTLSASQILTIDCGFGKKTMLTQDGASQAQYLVPGSQLFSLVPGVNVISYSMSGVTSPVTNVQCTYKQRYFAP